MCQLSFCAKPLIRSSRAQKHCALRSKNPTESCLITIQPHRTQLVRTEADASQIFPFHSNITVDFFSFFFYNAIVSNETESGDYMNHILNSREWEHLERCPLFAGCSRSQTEAALSDESCCVQTFASGQTLYRPNHFSRCLGVLLSGQVRVTRDALVISVLSPGDLFGAAALFNDRPDYATTLTASTPCRVVLFPQEQISRMMDASPRIRDNYIRYLSGRIRFLSSKIQSLAADGADGKLAQYLLTNLTAERPRLDCPATELAHRLGISRASLYRAFDSLCEQGLICRKGRTITVPDLGMLESCTL